ncbi:Cysteine-rich secretory protein family protein [Flavobacteriaceae bacterium MAR_2010_72]|nr:Cysteine-rich secretory protein family protein [Flavobacteriaceae bacterium MAR_2010_72]TVZ57921.1 Cysteine-rich secretory protein family protein [Flavobacteriaceae bacterium MAR_2010_105]
MKRVALITCLLTLNIMITSCSTEAPETELILVENVASLEEIKSIEIEILELINAYRITKDLSVLLKNEQIRTQTAKHTNYMITNESASHDNFFIRKSYLITHASANKVSENVACGYSNAQSVFNAWLNSETHRLNIEGDYTHFNITAEQDNNDKWYFTNIFMNTNN